MIGIGLLLIVAAFRGGARWLIAPAVALAVPLGRGLRGRHLVRRRGRRARLPAARSAAIEDGYELGIGRLAVDLRELDWSEKQGGRRSRSTWASARRSSRSPRRLRDDRLRRRAGDIGSLGDRSDGFDVAQRRQAGATATPRLELTAT